MVEGGLSLDINLDSTLGAAFCGFAASSVLYGVLSTQVWTYYKRYSSDRFNKIFVAIVWTLETIDQAFIGHSVYYYSITNYANPIALLVEKPTWTLVLQVTFGAIVGTMVKTAFSLRVWRLSNRNIFITAYLLLLTYAQLALAIDYTIKGFGLSTLTKLSQLKFIGSLALGAGVLTDISIAATLCYYLFKLRTEFSRSNALVNNLMLHAVDTGFLTSAFSLPTLILYNINPNNFVFMCFYFMVSKLYATTFLAALNARKSAASSISRGTSDYRSSERDTGVGSKVVVISRQRSASRGHRQYMPEQAEEFQMKIDVHREVVSVISDSPTTPNSSTSDPPFIGIAK